MANTEIPTWDELLDSMNTAEQHPEDTGWAIYRYLNAHCGEMSSAEARTLLASYMKLPMRRPSLLHSCILSASVKVAEKFDDFKLPAFLNLWGYPDYLRSDDEERQTGKDGRTYRSLKHKVEAALQTYLLHHPDDREGASANIKTMLAVKVFETMKNGRKMRSVRLVDSEGVTLLCDSHLFPCKPWEIQGQVFDVILRTSKEGNVRAQEIALSQRKVEELFPAVIGYADSFDSQHQHYHIFDNQSRHFVAENPKLRPVVGQYVWFAPIVPREDKFKVAIPLRNASIDEGRASFGMLDATITYVNTEKDYFYYKITSPLPATPEGQLTAEGSGKISAFSTQLRVGQHIRAIIFLKRGKDGTKRNHMAEAILC